MKKILFIVATLMGLLTLHSCEDFLDAENKSKVDSNTYFTTEAGFETLVNFAYARLKPLYGGSIAMFSSGTDLYNSGRGDMPDVALHNYKDLVSTNSTVEDFYTDCYIGIQAANCVLYYADKVDADATLIALRKAEARFLRAYFYYELVQHFGGVPIVQDYVNEIVINLPRDTKETVFSFIFTEWEDILNNSTLPDKDLNGRVNKQAIKHFLAKAYLTAGWDLNNAAYFTTAATYAEAAIAMGTGLDETYDQLWWPSKDNAHQEVLFAIQYDRASSLAAGITEEDNGNNLQFWYGQYLGGADQGYKYTSSTALPSLRLMMLFQPGDSRYNASFMEELYCTDASTLVLKQTTGNYYAPYITGGTAGLSVAFYYPPWYASDPADIAAWRAEDPAARSQTIVIPMKDPTIHPDEQPCSYYEACTVGNAPFGIVNITKFDDPESTFGANKCYRDIVLARLGETYLIAAEAWLKVGGNQTKVDQYINVVRERAFMGSGLLPAEYQVTDADIDDLLEERALELAFEKFRWTDLRRTKKLVEYNVLYNPEFGEEADFIGPDGKQKVYRPIPQQALNLNTAGNAQNDGY